MKPFLIILCFISIDLFGQNNFEIEFVDSLPPYQKELRMMRDSMIPEVFIKQKLKWSDWEKSLPASEKDWYLKRLIGNKFYPSPFYIVREDYHLIDFNGDKRLDVIFAGREPPGGEINNFAFFENQGDSLLLTLKLTGTIIEIIRENLESPISFVVWKWPCCAQQVHNIHYYCFYNGSDLNYSKNIDAGFYNVSYGQYHKNKYPNFQKKANYMYIKSTYLPDSINFKSDLKYRIKADTTNLETNPNNNFSYRRMMEYIPEKTKFNIIVSVITKGNEGVILKKRKFGGDEYFFVKTSIKKAISELNINNKSVENILGWVKAADVVIIE